MMYCPRCGTDNLNEASFCRACGADIRLVSKAMTGRLTVAPPSAPTESDVPAKREDKETVPVRLDQVFENIFVGLAFLAIVLGGAIFFRAGFMIWIWFIIPAFTCAGRGIGQYLRYRQEQQQSGRLPLPTSAPESVRAAETSAPPLLSRNTSEMFSLGTPPPPSVTEGTTRYLDAKRKEASAAHTQNEQAE